MSRYVKRKTPSSSSSIRVSWDLTAFVRWVLNRSRLTRVLMVSLFGLATTLAVFPIVDYVYLEHFFNEGTVILPSLVSVGAGIIMYILGWRLIVGTIGEDRPVRPAVFWYTVVGILAILLVIGLTLQGYSIVNAPDV